MENGLSTTGDVKLDKDIKTWLEYDKVGGMTTCPHEFLLQGKCDSSRCRVRIIIIYNNTMHLRHITLM